MMNSRGADLIGAGSRGPESTSVGFFGKLPRAGDFVQRRLPPRFVEAWDRSFELAVDDSRRALGNHWQEAYRTSPVWRFMLAPGVCTDAAWVGVMGPAVDRVGRCFPMVIAAPLVGDLASVEQALCGEDWFDALERVHLDAQSDPSTSVDTFDAWVAALPGPIDASGIDASNLWQDIDWSAASHWRLPLQTRQTIGSPLTQLWARLSTTRGDWCLWWTRGGGAVPASMLVTQGLPQPSAYAGFLDAAHAGAPWESLGVFDSAAHHVGDMASASVTLQPADVPSAHAASVAQTRLPDDLSELFADLIPVQATADTPAQAVDAFVDVDRTNPLPSTGVVVQYRNDSALTLVAADDGVHDPRRQAAVAVGQTVDGFAAGDFAMGMQALRAQLLALHPRLRLATVDLIDPVAEDGAVIAARITDRWADLLRIGTAAAWHWRRGQLQPLFATGDVAPASEDTTLTGDFDDLLFSRTSLVAPGLGAVAQPMCDEVVCEIEAGDRLLLIATRGLVQLPPDVFARALAMPSCDDARARIATAASLGPEPARWPLAVIEITS